MCWKRGRKLFCGGKTSCGRWDEWDEHPELPLQSAEGKWQLCGASHFSLLTAEGTWTSLALLKLRELNPSLGDAVWHIFYAGIRTSGYKYFMCGTAPVALGNFLGVGKEQKGICQLGGSKRLCRDAFFSAHVSHLSAVGGFD